LNINCTDHHCERGLLVFVAVAAVESVFKVNSRAPELISKEVNWRAASSPESGAPQPPRALIRLINTGNTRAEKEVYTGECGRSSGRASLLHTYAVFGFRKRGCECAIAIHRNIAPLPHSKQLTITLSFMMHQDGTKSDKTKVCWKIRKRLYRDETCVQVLRTL